MVPNHGTAHKITFVKQTVIYSWSVTTQHKYTNDSENNYSFKMYDKARWNLERYTEVQYIHKRFHLRSPCPILL